MPATEKIVVFTPAFIEWSTHREPVPLTSQEAFWSGPWTVAEKHNEFVVHRVGDPTPMAFTRYRETALLVAAALPAVGRGPLYWLSGEKNKTHGMYDLLTILGEKGLDAVGRLECRYDEILCVLSTIEFLLRCSASLSFLIEAAPRDVLEQVNRLVSDRLAREADQ